jgi:hypothetical protein
LSRDRSGVRALDDWITMGQRTPCLAVGGDACSKERAPRSRAHARSGSGQGSGRRTKRRATYDSARGAFRCAARGWEGVTGDPRAACRAVVAVWETWRGRSRWHRRRAAGRRELAHSTSASDTSRTSVDWPQTNHQELNMWPNASRQRATRCRCTGLWNLASGPCDPSRSTSCSRSWRRRVANRAAAPSHRGS